MKYIKADDLIIIMEYVNNGSLKAFIEKHKTENVTMGRITALQIITQLCSIVNYLHNTVNIIHRDIKPENILIRDDPMTTDVNILLIDFEFAVKKKLNNYNACGTKRFMAPEMFVRNWRYDEKVDVWALGKTCMEILDVCDNRACDDIRNFVNNNMLVHDPNARTPVSEIVTASIFNASIFDARIFNDRNPY